MKAQVTAALAIAITFIACCSKEEPTKEDQAPAAATTASATVTPGMHQLATQPGVESISKRCMECHEDVYHHWQESHHGQANRLISWDNEDDRLAFDNESFESPNHSWKFYREGDDAIVEFNGKKHIARMAIGITPLIQYLTEDVDGRWATVSAAWDPEKKEWFDTFDMDDRTESDWGHWTNRGMNWNVQCAYCHMTEFHKNYDPETDAYSSTWTEMAISCVQCHGDIAEKPSDNGCLIDLKEHASVPRETVIESCATCHSRRGEFDDDFKFGDKYADHYMLTLPTEPHLYYADGQILNEDYVWGSLRQSKMGHKGIDCLNCHDPHSTKLKLPIEGNMICLQCHATGVDGAQIINPTEHSFHPEDSTGNSCVECHMRQTTYMGRDPRRDHGFHIPDPLLTKELGIPNSCNECHDKLGNEGEDVDWAIKWVDEWYGDKMKRPERNRTRAIQRAFNGEYAIDDLLAVYPEQVNPFWQATLLRTMLPWAHDPRLQELAQGASRHEDPLVRVTAVPIIAQMPNANAWLEPMLSDEIREVRLAAAFEMREDLSQASSIRKELEASLNHTSDQPAGAMRRGQMAVSRGKREEAARWMKKATEWDSSSPAPYEAYAVVLGQLNKPEEALEQLKVATDLDTTSPRYPYLMALTLAELGKLDEAEANFRESVRREPRFDRAWYNLGLLLAQQEKLGEAVVALKNAEMANNTEPNYPYARATVHARMNDLDAAREACIDALTIDRSHQPSLQFLSRLGPGKQQGGQ